MKAPCGAGLGAVALSILTASSFPPLPWASHLSIPSLPRSMYIHVPFCRRRCFYCDFPVHVVGEAPEAAPAAAKAYLALLLRELGLYEASFGKAVRTTGGLETVYVGGGTPSLLPPAMLRECLDMVKTGFGFAEGVEVTLEADPGTFDRAKLEALVQCGVTRVSLGVQSFDDNHLEVAGRAHTAQDAEDAVQHVKEVVHSVHGGTWSMDLISGLPGQSADSWKATLERTARLRPPHISVYDLQVEPRTAFDRWASTGRLLFPTEEEAAEAYRAASTTLRAAGYEHYEISSYARTDDGDVMDSGQSRHRSRHNSVYWALKPFFGVGMGAASFLHGVRDSRPRTLGAYEEWLRDAEVHGLDAALGMLDKEHHPPRGTETEEEAALDRFLEELMLGLRTSEGFDLVRCEYTFGAALARVVAREAESFVSTGLLAVEERGSRGSNNATPSRVLRLTDPEGFLMSNEVISSLFSAASRTRRSSVRNGEERGGIEAKS